MEFKKLLLHSILIAFCLSPIAGYAAIYKSKDGYSDKKSPGSEKVILPPENISKQPKYNNQTQQSTEPKSDDQAVVDPDSHYKGFSLSQPENEQNIHNQREILVKVDVKPKLRKGDKIQLLLDGQVADKAKANDQQTLKILERGTHTIQAQLLDKNGNVIRSTQTVTVYIHFHSIR